MNKKPTLYYDAKCKLCNIWLNLIRRYDKKSRIEYTALQSETGQRVIEIMNAKYRDIDTVIFEKEGKIYIRSEAVIESVSELGGLWAGVKILRIFPAVIRDWAYDIIARNRYKWFGKMDNCDIISEF